MPRVPLVSLPTPLHACPRLSSGLGPEIWMKRDDMTGLALGGSKVRGLEFVLADALARGATTVICGSRVGTNLPRALAGACRQLGLKPCLLLRGDKPRVPEGNMVVDLLLGAELRFVSAAAYDADYTGLAGSWADELQRSGERPYVMDATVADSRSLALQAIGYMAGLLELEMQTQEQGVDFQWIFCCSSSATQAGLVLAQTLLDDRPYRIVGVNALSGDAAPKIVSVANSAARLIDVPSSVGLEHVVSMDDYIGPGHALPTAAGLSAMRFVAEQEGVLLDPVYTGKTFAALVDSIERGVVRRSDRALFWHTGGAPTLFTRQFVEFMAPNWNATM
jgi:1-aminocyclopropane-1-carboxylate deaminase/D-cysteine desulfhydrase-like pyridoxal-dependent ACC family enzyme